MHYQLTQLLIFGCYIISIAESVFLFNMSSTNKILCYSCKGSNCETVSHDDDNVVLCDKNTQLCWAGYVDKQPYRTCSSRYCTPNDISLDNDIHIETCCHSNLCNSLSLSWLKWHKSTTKSSTDKPKNSSVTTTTVSTKQTTTKNSKNPQIYIVNEIVNGEEKSLLNEETNEEQENLLIHRLKFNASDPSTFGIIWNRIPFNNAFNNHITLISKLFIFHMSVLLILLF